MGLDEWNVNFSYWEERLESEMTMDTIHFKECKPEDTIERIRKILNDFHIEVEESFQQRDETINTYSSRVTLKNTTIGTNGKGISREYCQASAYAEFMERLQNNIIFGGRELRYPNREKSFYLEIDEKLMTAKEIVESNGSATKEYFKELGVDGLSDEQKIVYFKELQQIEELMIEKKDLHVAIPFYNITKKQIEYVPALSCFAMYGSNGMSAGNSFDEAIVQGLSEIIERHVQAKVIRERICLPNVPDEVVKQYPYIYEMYTSIKNRGKQTVFIKDASLGGKYPVAALVLIDKDTRRFGVKFGCHPDFGVAMQRAFTEATQGRSIEQYSKLGFIDFTNKEVDLDFNILSGFQTGEAQMPYEFFGRDFTYQYSPIKAIVGRSNHEIAEQWIKSLIAEGFDILIRNASKMGFPACRILIPGLSNINKISESKVRLINTRMYLIDKLENIELIKKIDCDYIMTVIKKFEKYKGEVELSKFFPNKCVHLFPGEDVHAGAHYLATMCALYCKEYRKAVYFSSVVYSVACNSSSISSEKRTFYLAVKSYAEAMNKMNSHTASLEYLKNLFSKYICATLDDYFGVPEQILNKQYKKLMTYKDENLMNAMHHVYEGINKAYSQFVIDQDELRNLFVSDN